LHKHANDMIGYDTLQHDILTIAQKLMAGYPAQRTTSNHYINLSPTTDTEFSTGS